MSRSRVDPILLASRPRRADRAGSIGRPRRRPLSRHPRPRQLAAHRRRRRWSRIARTGVRWVLRVPRPFWLGLLIGLLGGILSALLLTPSSGALPSVAHAAGWASTHLAPH